MIEGIITAFIAGAGYGIIGYAKNKDYTDFDWKQFASTVLGTTIIGGLAYNAGIGIDAYSASAIGIVVIQASKKIVTTVYEKLKQKGWFLPELS